MAEHRAMQHLLRPRSIAVVGASRDERSVGGVLFHNLHSGGFTGDIYPVNPNTDEVQGVPAVATIDACPTVPDLVIVIVPAEAVAGVVDQAGQHGVDAVCVISAGFAEVGEDGQERQQQLREIIRRHGMRLVGPNGMGVLNAAEGVRMNATFSQAFPGPGRIGLLSQSGALGLAVLGAVEELGLGLSSFVSVGNTADVGAVDLLRFWDEDPDTDVVLLYLESFGEPRQFSRVARRMSQDTPIVAVKSGRTGAGEHAASSHTAAVTGQDVAVDALFRQAGVIRTDTLSELFDVSRLLLAHRGLRGSRVGIVTNGGGPGILAADACEANGLTVPALSDDVQRELAQVLPSAAATRNPVDVLAGAGAETFRRATDIVGGSEEIDVVLAIFVPAIVVHPGDMADALIDVRDQLPEDVPLVSVFMASEGRPELGAAGIADYPHPEEAARALGDVARWSDWRRRPDGSIVRPIGIDTQRGRAVIDQALATANADDEVWLSGGQAIELLAAYDVPTAPSRIVEDAEDAAAVQTELGTPVAVKIDAPVHKTDIGGVELGLSTPEATAAAVRAIDEALVQADLARLQGSYLVQQMVDDGVEMAIGVQHDPVFGPLLMVGFGGELMELIEDVSARITPVTDVDVPEMIGSLKAHELLSGYRDRPPADVEALQQLIHRIDSLVDDVPEIAELDLNPVFVHEDGVTAVDVRVRLQP